MKVQDMIEILQTYPKDSDVVVEMAVKHSPAQYVEEYEEVGFDIYHTIADKVKISLDGVYYV